MGKLIVSLSPHAHGNETVEKNMYLPKYPTPGMLYAAVEIQNPHGIRGYILTLLKGELHKWKK